MSNLSKQKRQRMLDFLNTLKEKNSDDEEYIRAIQEIEIELNSKKYGLVWEKHEEEVDIQMKDNIPVFTEVKEKEIQADKDKKYNFLLEGDNLHSLKLLQKTHRNKIDVIYIDPPYNTKNKEFIYNDKMIGEDDGYRHSKWLSFMSERLEIAKDLLTDDGVIFISIDDNEQAQLKLLCDSIFGEGNKLGVISVINNMKGRSDDKFFATCNEFLLVYSKNSTMINIKGYEISEEELDDEYTFQDSLGIYKLTGLRKTGKGWRREDRPFMYYPILKKIEKFYSITDEEHSKIYNKETKRFNDDYLKVLISNYENEGFEIFMPYDTQGNKGRWRWGIETFRKQKDINVECNSNNVPSVKMRARLEDGSLRTKTHKTVWYKSEYDTGSAGRILDKILDKKNVFDNPKSITFIKDIIDLIPKHSAIVLDFFAGYRVIIMITADSNDGDWLSSPLLKNKNMDWCAF